MTLDAEEKQNVGEVYGSVAPGFEKVRDAFQENISSGLEVGASFAAYQHGKKVVDLWGGFADKARTRPWAEHTLTNIWSTTKGMAAIVLARLVEQGKVDYSAKITDYWPEFGAEGKDKLSVGQVISHQAGIPLSPEGTSVEDFYVPGRMAALLAPLKPHWEPGSRSGYHAVNYGWLIGELVQRVSGKSLGTLFQEEVAGPLGAEVFIGLPESEEPKVAELIGYDAKGTADVDRTPLQKMSYEGLGDVMLSPNTRAWRAAEIPAAGGQANARGVACVYGALANGGEMNGVHILKPETIALATEEEISNPDLILGVPISWGRGFIRNVAKIVYGPNAVAFGHSGWGGSMGYADPSTGLGVSYVMNRMQVNLAGDQRSLRLNAALYESL